MKRRSIKRKGQIRGLVTLLVILFAVSMGIVAAKVMHNVFTDSIASTPVGNNSDVQDVQTTFDAGMDETADTFLVALLFSITIALLINSYFINTHPVFMWINIAGILILGLYAALLSNMYGIITSNDVLGTYLDNADGSLGLTKQGFIMQYLPWLCFAITIITTIVMYAKTKNE